MMTLSGLTVYPIKSCGGVALNEARIGEQGLQLDRNWMLVDKQGHFLSQREHAAMAAITVSIKESSLAVSAPGMPTLCISLQHDDAARRVPVTIWNDGIDARDCGADMHDWFSSFLGTEARLVRFDPRVRRACSPRWSKSIPATTQFSDGFPLLVIGEASLLDLNQRLQHKGAPAISMDRFRPNVVIAGLEAYEEDYIDTLTIGEASREVVLKLVKPCIRCTIPSVDQRTGLRDPRWPDEPLDTMATYRANARVAGGLTFGQNALVTQGAGMLVRSGDKIRYDIAF